MSDLTYWLALNFLPDIGPVVVRRLLSAFGSPEDIFRMPERELMEVEGVGENRVKGITGFNNWDAVQKEIEFARKNKVRLVPLSDPAYPEGLRHIQDAPPVLYVKGDLKESDKFAIAIVGSRAATDYGMQIAERMGYRLACSGLTVISGMARGIDAAAHKGAIKARGRTIAVTGSGIDVPYPASNRGLMGVIASSGAVISEFPFGTRPHKENFPKRNRIISAMSFGVIVVEATLDSGSLITVGYALEQGKEIFAVPGNITSKNSRGTNALIKRGAKLVESAEEVIDELRLQLKGVLKEDKSRSGSKPLPEMTDDEAELFNYLGTEPKHVDAIIRETDMTTEKVLSLLLKLELKGVVRQTQGKHYLLT